MTIYSIGIMIFLKTPRVLRNI